MPGWHAHTKPLVEAGKLQVAGIVQEQHPDRAALYMQWQQMKWPLMADPFNDLGIKAVPITLLIDEHGIIRYINPQKADLKTFLAAAYPKTGTPKTPTPLPTNINTLRKIKKDARMHFRMGVAYRKQYDSKQRQEGDFTKAIASWKQALKLDPNQYIWRRRIQQYGPRLDKPYSFYDWVHKARKDIIARGEKPHPLTCEPGGSEFAYPERQGGKAAAVVEHPDPDGKVTRDQANLITTQTVIVPSTKGDGKAIRVHLSFRPTATVHWTNDAGTLSFHPEAHANVTIHDLQHPKLPALPSSNEERVIEFEVRPKKGKTLPKTIKGAAFYYVCEDVGGVCQYLRRDIEISLQEK